ncbi:MAG: hypothetical protein GYB53_11520 [Rhodobacteraceae bacterium]|nr:hypothetical protein [Paracoccaceae bacterium]MBR9820739.1 hypothetical protein [Paracoccaceae bacterium]
MHTRTTPTHLKLVTQGEIFARRPSDLQANWAEAKRQAGQPISPERMARLLPAHLTEAIDVPHGHSVTEQIAPYMRRTQLRVREIIATLPARGGAGGGDAA